MICIEVDGKVIGIPGEVIAREVAASLPEWLRPGGEATLKQSVIKSAVKGVLPMMLEMIHLDIVKRQAPIPAPDVQSAEARADIIGYALSYMISNFSLMAGMETYHAEGGEADGVWVVSGLVARSANVAESVESSERAADDRAAAGAPAS